MSKQFLPRDGSIVIVDDKIEEAKPLIDMLSNVGCSASYFNGDLKTLPQQPLSKVRFFFADIQLLPLLNEHQYADLIANHIDRLISPENGPYVLITWSQKGQLFANAITDRVMNAGFAKKPVAIVRLNKSDFFTTTIDNSIENDIDDAIDPLDSRFTPQDIAEIKKAVRNKFSSEKKQLKKDALSRISKKILVGIKYFKGFDLLLEWEHIVHESSAKHVSNLAAIHKYDENWDLNFRNLISRLAYAQLEQNSEYLKGANLLNSTFKTINVSFLDTLNVGAAKSIANSRWKALDFKNTAYRRILNHKDITIRWKDFSSFQLELNGAIQNPGTPRKIINDLPKNASAGDKSEVAKVVEEYVLIAPELNTKLLIDTTTKKPHQPGIVYEVKVRKDRKRNILKEYAAKLTEKGPTGAFLIKKKEIDKVKFIEVEVSPTCDFAQRKWLKSRLISGVLFPSDSELKWNESGDFKYRLPEIIFQNKRWQMIFDFRLLKSLDIDVASIRGTVLFRLKNEPLADIVTRMSSHASRIGIIAVH